MRLTARILLCAAASRAWGAAGPPPFDWTVTGPLADERQVAVTVEADGGTGRGFAGGDRRTSFQPRDYAVAPVALHYGVRRAWEAFAVAPVVWAASDLRGESAFTGAALEASPTGADLGDPAAGVRWNAGGGDAEDAALLFGLGVVAPLGWDPWRSRAHNLVGSDGEPEQAFGDGAWKAVVTFERLRSTTGFRYSALGGVVVRWPVAYPVAQTFFFSDRSAITVREPSTALAQVRAEWRVSDAWWAGLRAEGDWRAGGRITAGGDLAADPALMTQRIGGYANLAKDGGAAWLGGGVAGPLGPAAIRLDVLAPVAARRSYRYWRVGLAVSAGWTPSSS